MSLLNKPGKRIYRNFMDSGNEVALNSLQNYGVAGQKLFVWLTAVPQEIFRITFLYNKNTINDPVAKSWKKANNVAINKSELADKDLILHITQGLCLAYLIDFGNINSEFKEKTGIDKKFINDVLRTNREQGKIIAKYIKHFLNTDGINRPYAYVELVLRVSGASESDTKNVSEKLLNSPLAQTSYSGIIMHFLADCKKSLEVRE